MVHDFFITGIKTVTLAIGSLITLFAYRAYQRTGSPALRALALGFGVVTLGSLTAGAIDILLPSVERDLALIVESSLTATGFAVILYSLYVE